MRARVERVLVLADVEPVRVRRRERVGRGHVVAVVHAQLGAVRADRVHLLLGALGARHDDGAVAARRREHGHRGRGVA